jgi:RNA polymerase sigma factor (sigma-70 family)
VAPLTQTDIAEAWLGFRRRLQRCGFPRRFIESQGADLFARAQLEFVEATSGGAHIHSPRGWLIVCAWRRAINAVDGKSRAPSVSSIEDFATPPVSPEPTPEEVAIAGEQARRVRELVTLLLPEEQAIVELVEFEGMSCRQAAAVLDWSSTKADRWHSRALGRLRALYVDGRLQLDNDPSL